MAVQKRKILIEEMRDMLLDGRHYTEIAASAGISRQRVEQLLSPPRHLMTKVRERAQDRCEDCGILIHKGAHLHHINGDNLDPNQYNGIENIKYLCPSCHKREHRTLFKTCKTCNILFYARGVSQGFCSEECHIKYYSRSAKCEYCGKEFTLSGKKANELKWRQIKNKHIFCSRSCCGKFKYPKGIKIGTQANRQAGAPG